MLPVAKTFHEVCIMMKWFTRDHVTPVPSSNEHRSTDEDDGSWCLQRNELRRRYDCLLDVPPERSETEKGTNWKAAV